LQPVIAMKARELDDGVMSSDLMRFLSHCERLADGQTMPFYRDFRLADVPWMAGKLYMVEVIDGGEDYRFRVVGEIIARLQCSDCTGKRFSEIDCCPGTTEALRAELDRMLLMREPLYRRGRMIWPGREYIGVERLIVPLADETGDLIVVLGALQPALPIEDLVLFMGQGKPRFEFEPYTDTVAA
jgi:hypothetical protein